MSADALPFRGEQPHMMIADLVVSGVLDLDDEQLWVPQSERVHFRPLVLSVSQGWFVNLLRVRRSGVMSRHRHAGPVVALTLRGRWHYLEHNWWAEKGSLAFEPPEETHTLFVPANVTEMITLFHVTGTSAYVDPDGGATGYEDVFTKVEAARHHYEDVGLGGSFVDQFVR